MCDNNVWALASKRGCLWILLLLLLFASAVPSSAHENCSTLTLTGSTSVFEQVVSFLADEKMQVAGAVIGVVGKVAESEEITSLGKGVDHIHQIAEAAMKNPVLKTTGLRICTTQQVLLPGHSPVTVIGRPSDLGSLGVGSLPTLNDMVNGFLAAHPSPNTSVSSPTGGNDWGAPLGAALSGTVFDVLGNRIPGAVVTLSPSSSTPAQPLLRSQITLADGTYFFTGMPGEYFISARLSTPGRELLSNTETVTLYAVFPSNLNLRVYPQKQPWRP